MAKTKTKTLKGTGKTYRGSNSASVIDIIKVYGKKNTVKALNGNDKITVYKGGSHKILGGDGKDMIILNKNVGEKIKVNGGSGVDKITVKGGGSYANHVIHGDGGNDVITVAKGNSIMRSKFYGDKGNDTFKINAGIQNKFFGGAGADTFKVNGGGATTISTGGSKGTKKYDRVYIGQNYNSSVTVNGGAQKDYVKILGGSENIIKTAGGNDVIEIGSAKKRITSSKLDINLGAGNDKVTATNLARISVTDGKGKDAITISKAGSAIINAGAGTNTIKVSGTDYVQVYASGAKATNKITLSGGKSYIVRGDLNKTGSTNIVNIKSGNSANIDGNPGKDKITVNGGSDHTIYIGNRNAFGDTVTVNKGKNISVTLNSETSNSTAILKGGETTLTLWNRSSDTIHVYFSGKEKNSVAINYKSSGGVGTSGGVYTPGDSTHKKVILHGLSNYSVKFDQNDYGAGGVGGSLEIKSGGSSLTMDHWKCVTKIYDISVAGADGSINPWKEQSKYV